MINYPLWEKSEKNPTQLHYYPSTYKVSRAAVVILPGGSYSSHAEYEGKGYAELFNTLGIDSFVLNYRIYPERFPLPLLDARRAVRFLRSRADELGIDKQKILVVGSSAGGHLAALLSTFFLPIEGENVDAVDEENFIPDGQILCYPVISSDDEFGHLHSYSHLLGDRFSEKDKYSPERLVSERTPKTFIWHTSTDKSVNVINCYRYGEALARKGVSCEMHVFPVGDHGCAFAPHVTNVCAWIELLRKWLIYNGFVDTIV